MCFLSNLSILQGSLHRELCSSPSCRPRGEHHLLTEGALPSAGYPGCHKLRRLPPPAVPSSYPDSPPSLSPSGLKCHTPPPPTSRGSQPEAKPNQTNLSLLFWPLTSFSTKVYSSFPSHCLLSPSLSALCALKNFPSKLPVTTSQSRPHPGPSHLSAHRSLP